MSVTYHAELLPGTYYGDLLRRLVTETHYGDSLRRLIAETHYGDSLRRLIAETHCGDSLRRLITETQYGDSLRVPQRLAMDERRGQKAHITGHKAHNANHKTHNTHHTTNDAGHSPRMSSLDAHRAPQNTIRAAQSEHVERVPKTLCRGVSPIFPNTFDYCRIRIRSQNESN